MITHALTRNKFILMMNNASRISFKSLRVWAEQQYFMSISLSQCFAALYVRSPLKLWRCRLPLLKLASGEAWGNGTDNHGCAFLKFYKSVGGDSEALYDLTATLATEAAAQGRLEICRGDFGNDVAESALALAYANEFANLFIFGKLRRAIQKSTLTNIDLAYFDAHINGEVLDTSTLVDFGCLMWSSHSSLDKAVEATDKMLDLRRRFFDEIADNLEKAAREAALSDKSACAN